MPLNAWHIKKGEVTGLNYFVLICCQFSSFKNPGPNAQKNLTRIKTH